MWQMRGKLPGGIVAHTIVEDLSGIHGCFACTGHTGIGYAFVRLVLSIQIDIIRMHTLGTAVGLPDNGGGGDAPSLWRCIPGLSGAAYGPLHGMAFWQALHDLRAVQAVGVRHGCAAALEWISSCGGGGMTFTAYPHDVAFFAALRRASHRMLS